MRLNWKIIVIGIIGVILGILGNMYANKLSEGRIIKALTAEIESLKAKRIMNRSMPGDDMLIEQLQAQLNILKNQ